MPTGRTERTAAADLRRSFFQVYGIGILFLLLLPAGGVSELLEASKQAVGPTTLFRSLLQAFIILRKLLLIHARPADSDFLFRCHSGFISKSLLKVSSFPFRIR